jgi:hypothetical protein
MALPPAMTLLLLHISQGLHMTSESVCHVPGISYNKLHWNNQTVYLVLQPYKHVSLFTRAGIAQLL